MLQTENQAANFLLEAFFRSALLCICIIKTLYPLLLAGFGNLMPFVMHNNSIENVMHYSSSQSAAQTKNEVS